MAENDSEKTVKLSIGGATPQPSPDKTSQISADKTSQISAGEKTVKLTLGDEKTVKLSPTPVAPPPPPTAPDQSKQSQKPLDIPPPAPTPVSSPSVPPPPLPPKPAVLKKTSYKVPLILLLILLVAGGVIWFFGPKFLRDNAQKLSSGGDHSNAAQRLKWALMVFPLDAESIKIDLGREYRLSKDYLNAQKVLEQVIQKNSAASKAMKELGLTYNESGQKQKALDVFQKYIGINSGDLDVTRSVGQIAFELKNYPVAVSAYEKLVPASLSNGNDFYQLGISYLELDKPAESEKVLLASLEKDKTIKGVNKLLGKIYLSQNKFMEALNRYGDELVLDPQDKETQASFAESCKKAGEFSSSQRKFQDAVAIYERGLTVPSEYDAVFHYQISVLSSKLKDKNRVLSHLEDAVKKDPALKAKAKKDPAFVFYKKSAAFLKIVK